MAGQDYSMLIYAYVRISPTELQGNTKEEKMQSAQRRLQLQRDKISKYLSVVHPTKEIHFYEDILITGKFVDHREGFKKLIDDAVKEKPFAVAFTKISRFARSLKDLLIYSDILKDNEIALIAVNENFDTSTASGRLFFQTLGAFAEWEIEVIRERTKEGKNEKQAEMEAEGKNWGMPRYSYRDKLDGIRKVLDPVEVKKIYNQGKTIPQVALHFHCSVTPIKKIIKGV